MKVELIITRQVLIEKFSIKNKVENEVESFFLSNLDGCEIKMSNRYENDIFYVKDDIVLFKYNTISKSFSVDFQFIWSVFVRCFEMTPQEIEVSIKGLLEEYVKLEVYSVKYNSCDVALEKNLKLYGYAPKTIEK